MATVSRTDPVFAAENARLRRELAACYRLCALFGWDDHIATHISARLPDGTFLLNPFGMLYEEITASSLMRVDMDGTVLEPEDHSMNPAAFTIHSAVLAGREDVNCAIHLHTRDGAAVSATREGLLPLNQTAMIVLHDLAYHDFEGIAFDLDERESLQADLGEKNLMILRNHGTLTVGASIGAAFYRMQTLEWACAAQVKTLAMTDDPLLPAQDVQDKMIGQSGFTTRSDFTDDFYWAAMMRKAERDCPGFDA